MAKLASGQYFSLMEYLEFLYAQNLPTQIERGKKNYLSMLNACLMKYSKSFGNIELDKLMAVASNSQSFEFDCQNSKAHRRNSKIKSIDIKLNKALKHIKNYSNDSSNIHTVMNAVAKYKVDMQGCRKLLKKSGSDDFNALKTFLKQDESYSKLKPFNIAVCAPMSAGKSTLVNALLGSDVLPSMNEATTAKITSVYDKDGLTKIRGFRQKKVGKDFSNDVDLKILREWNSSADTERVYLQGDLDGIRNTTKLAVAVHDTPGTNNSQDSSHHNVTMNFLDSEKLDALVYVANYEHLLTTDEDYLLNEVWEKIKNRNIPIIFVLNKMDSFDKEKENFVTSVECLRNKAITLGYRDFEIIPVAAKPARLFKMALNGKAGQFTESECDSFGILFNKFTKRMNINRMSENPIDYSAAEKYGSHQEAAVLVDEVCFDIQMLRQALVNTGLIGLEQALEKLLK